MLPAPAGAALPAAAAAPPAAPIGVASGSSVPTVGYFSLSSARTGEGESALAVGGAGEERAVDGSLARAEGKAFTLPRREHNGGPKLRPRAETLPTYSLGGCWDGGVRGGGGSPVVRMYFGRVILPSAVLPGSG